MPQNIDFELGPPIEGNLEASHLLEQIESLRGAVRFLRTENGYLKGQDLLKEIQSLPPLGPAPYDTPQTPHVAADGADELDSDDPSPTEGHVVHTKNKNTDAGLGMYGKGDGRGLAVTGEKTSLQALSTESKLLYRELLGYSASPKLIDLNVLERERKEGWIPQRKTAAYQLWERRREGDRLRKQVHGLRLQAARLVRIES